MTRRRKSEEMMARLEDPSVVALKAEATRLVDGLGSASVWLFPVVTTGRFRARAWLDGKEVRAEHEDPRWAMAEFVRLLRAEAAERRDRLNALLAEGAAR